MHNQSLPVGDRDEQPDKTGFKLSQEQQGVIDELVALQQTILVGGKVITDGEFAKRARLGSASRWSLIRSGNYFKSVKDVGTQFVKLRRALSLFKSVSQYSQRFEGKEFVANDVTKAVFCAVEECLGKPLADRRRIIVCTMPTGGGKSMLAWQLYEQYDAIVTNANAAWKGAGGWKALAQICRNMNFCSAESTHKHVLEENILAEMQSEQYLLVIDEGEYFGKGIIDSFKRFINESRVVIVILAIKEAYERWNKRFKMEAEQLQMRTHGIFDLEMTPDMALPYLQRLKWGRDENLLDCAKTAVERASQLGAFDLIDSTVTRLNGQTVDRKRFMAALADECARIGLKNTPTCGK